MRVSELKAELELRKIDYAGMFEKEELARCLADARAGGRADPSLLQVGDLLEDMSAGQIKGRALARQLSSAILPLVVAAAALALAQDSGLSVPW